jgi:hypothetical protein
MSGDSQIRHVISHFLYGIAFRLLCSVAISPHPNPASQLSVQTPARILGEGKSCYTWSDRVPRTQGDP